jgi:large subunit ribosomal protein L3
MTQVFTADGRAVPVTVIETPPCLVAQLKSAERDGYLAVQIATGPTSEKRIGRPRTGHLKKLGLPPLKRLMEFRVDTLEGFESGREIGIEEVFTVGDRVDVRGTSKGRGFAGTIRRHNFARGDMSHGGMSKRRPGSIGQCATPSRVFRGHRMAGQMGNKSLTVRNLELVRIDVENRFLLVKGAIPGALGGEVLVSKTKKGVRVPKFRPAEKKTAKGKKRGK